jgi:hypothetical protein
MFCSPKLVQTARKLPCLLISIEHLEVPAVGLFAIKGFYLAFEKNGVKQGSPSDAH